MSIESNCYIPLNGVWVHLGRGKTDGVKSGKSSRGGHAEVKAYNDARNGLPKGTNHKPISPTLYLFVQDEFPCGGCMADFTMWSNTMSFVFRVTEYDHSSQYYRDHGLAHPVNLPFLIYIHNRTVSYNAVPEGFPATPGGWPG